MIRTATWEELISQLTDLHDEQLAQVLDFIRFISSERSNKTAVGSPRFKLRDILRQAGPELFQAAGSN